MIYPLVDFYDLSIVRAWPQFSKANGSISGRRHEVASATGSVHFYSTHNVIIGCVRRGNTECIYDDFWRRWWGMSES